MKNFELFMGHLGNGITVCNKAVMEGGDYRKICHISEWGRIKWYVDIGCVPGKDLLTIEHEANVIYHKRNEEFEKMSEREQFRYLLNAVNVVDLLEFLKIKDKPLHEKIQFLKRKVINY